MMLSTSDFGAFHASVHDGKVPFSWQQRLLEQIVRNKVWPRVLDLPTGVGKTTCIDIAVFALALDAVNKPADRWCPRRIAMVVDRRVVVDQAAQRGRTILHALTTVKDPVVVEVADRLRSLTRAGEEPLGVFTLRGGMPKDDGWARTPDQPLVIASTVDQIGSRLLMQGYGVSQGMKPVHAGLLANDTLLLLDEVHLSEPFRQTLDQLHRLRHRFSNNGLKNRFAYAFLSATPAAENTQLFSLLDNEKQLDSPLGPRLHTSKSVRLEKVNGGKAPQSASSSSSQPKPISPEKVESRDALHKKCIECTKDLLQRHRTIAVVVNRVASALLIARELAEQLHSEATVTLLTGRMRPLDRDDVLRELGPAIRTGRERSDDTLKHVVVATQCIEAGADFDFDALVTEAASLDSLRQRFGRVNRLGAYGRAEGIIVYGSSVQEDPIYGKAIAVTWRFLKEQEKERKKRVVAELKELKAKAKKLAGEAKKQAEAEIARRKMLDFGVLSLKLPTGTALDMLLSPKPSAPTLLPAYMDLWAQTSPPPSQIPDVSLWLHGPGCGPPDVNIVWRADLSEELLLSGGVEMATAIVASVRPSSLEAVSVPFVAAQAWLANQAPHDLADTEGATPYTEQDPTAKGRPALRWSGDDSEIIFAPSLKPGDTIIVPVAYGGIRARCFDPSATEPVQDRAEQAQLLARAKPALRLHPAVLEQLGLALPIDEPEKARSALRDLASHPNWPSWKRLLAEHLARGHGSLVVPGDPPWTVIEAPRVPLAALRPSLGFDDPVEDGVELTTDRDDSFHAGRAVSLADHTADVESLARDYANRCGLDSKLTECITLAAWLHDIGKADRRFQIMLRGGNEIDLFKDETPWAKSPIPAGAREAHRRARLQSGYPQATRHEVQSVAMLQQHLAGLQTQLAKVGATAAHYLDLVLHLVASHHGYCRPFAPVAVDESPVGVSLVGHASNTFGALDFSPTTSHNGLYRLDSPLADRFWALVAKFGWLELCWLEAILRLADHRASEEEQTRGISP
jgi:CRISPR-associated endonuclease/helicase Cas3